MTMNIYNIMVGSIAMLVGIIIYFKKLDIVKSSERRNGSSPLLIRKEDDTQELVLGVRIGFNFIGCVFFLLGLGFILSEMF